MRGVEQWELVARECIRDLVARYNASGDAGRFDELMSLFAEDAVLELHGSRSYRGRDEIRSLFIGAAASEPGEAPVRIQHHASALQIDCESESRARGRCYFLVLTPAGADHWGRYVDAYRRQGDAWLFEHRCVRVDGVTPGGWGEKRLARSGG